MLEKFYDGIVAKGRAAGGVKSAIFNWAVGVALEWDPNKGGFYQIKLNLARKLVFGKVKEALGLSGIQAVASGSAALQPRLARFFNGAGITVLEGYGLTETSPVVSVNTTNGANMLKIGSVGKLADGVDVKIADDGEILVQGPNVMMGYYKDPEKTAEVLKDGWFHTGDIGVIEDGFLRITDRKKEIFKTSGGKYVAPTLLENALKASLFIEQVIVVGENRKHPAALIVPDAVVVEEWCKRHDHAFPGMAGIAGDDRLRATHRAGSQRPHGAVCQVGAGEEDHHPPCGVHHRRWRVDTHVEAEAQAHHGQVRRRRGGHVRLRSRLGNR